MNKKELDIKEAQIMSSKMWNIPLNTKWNQQVHTGDSSYEKCIYIYIINKQQK